MKKILMVSAVFAVAFALTASAAMARRGDGPRHGDDGSKLTIEAENEAKIINKVEVEAETGENSADRNGGRGRVTTGDADAYGNVLTDANSNDVRIANCGCLPKKGEVKIETENKAFVLNEVEVEADSGDNSADMNGTSRSRRSHHSHGSSNGSGVVDTGNAYAEGWVTTMVNSNVVRLGI